MARIITAVGEHLRKWRNERGLSQFQVSQLGDRDNALDQVTINQLENGKRRVSVAVALKLEKATGINAMDWLRMQLEQELKEARELEAADRQVTQ